ncbi:SpoIIE family protein phosphatase [Streptacidiphilus rugosus]|uniref:SpoIIE family protein phosphatase n=1 Tax=Streptacidiphilus rugosus TaxID=405783 RepID=UPI0006909684
MADSPLLSLRDVSKRFGAVHALVNVDLDVKAGEVVAVVGESGAGKSTLIRVMAGVEAPDTGSARWDGRAVDLSRPRTVRRLGVAAVHQDPELCLNLDVISQLFLGREMRRFGLLDDVGMEQKARRLLESLHVHIADLRAPLATLTAAERQSVAIAAALIDDPALLLLDEPTAGLDPQQSALLLNLVRRLRRSGLGVVLVSHNIDDVLAVADRVAVLRMGRNAGVFETRYASQEQIVSAVTGNQILAAALQRSLLPRDLPKLETLDTAFRYLPAQAGAGGDWFDVIPLSGARIALVVGDVVGHGLSAAATMGRLRTAVHNVSHLNLPPGELLAHLDDLVSRLDEERGAAGGHNDIIGATCIYAVYDPVARQLEVARAGHVPPLLVQPDGRAAFADVPAGPPLGLGGMPFETVELPLPDGARFLLYTDGLVERRDRDIDAGLDRLLQAVRQDGDPSPGRLCDDVIKALLPDDAVGGTPDDVALLVARAKGLPNGHVACFDVPTDPAAVAEIRAAAARRLHEWDLDDLTFTTELILSELITNAIRYASGPITVRMLRTRSLVCEVADASSTSPHVRYAATTDEGGRGLFLVAHLSERWGTRYTDRGKIIWAEQRLP